MLLIVYLCFKNIKEKNRKKKFDGFIQKKCPFSKKYEKIF